MWGGGGEGFQAIEMYFYTDTREIVSFEIQSTLQVYLSQLIFQNIFSDPRSFTLRYQQFEIRVVEIKIGNVSRLYPLIHECILRYQCSTYEQLIVLPALFLAKVSIYHGAFNFPLFLSSYFVF